MRLKIVNIGSDHKPQNIKLGLGISTDKRYDFNDLFKIYKDVFAWNYDDLKTYESSIIQHTIPMLPNVKPIQQKLRKIDPNLEAYINTKLNKILKAKIILPVRHSTWVSNLVPVRNKNGDIRICIEFRNLKKACGKDNFSLAPMEQI